MKTHWLLSYLDGFWGEERRIGSSQVRVPALLRDGAQEPSQRILTRDLSLTGPMSRPQAERDASLRVASQKGYCAT